MIQTERTLIRPVEIADEPDLFEIYKRPEVFEHFGSGVYTRERNKASIERSVGKWKELGRGDLIAEFEGKVIGRFILFPADTPEFELGYVLNPEYWGRGFASEIACALVEYAFSLGEIQVKACARKSNQVSRKLLKKLGFNETQRQIGEDGIIRIWYVVTKQ